MEEFLPEEELPISFHTEDIDFEPESPESLGAPIFDIPFSGWYWQIAGIAGMAAMFLFASIPMMEKRSLARRQDDQQVIDSVPMLLPRPPRN